MKRQSSYAGVIVMLSAAACGISGGSDREVGVANSSIHPTTTIAATDGSIWTDAEGRSCPGSVDSLITLLPSSLYLSLGRTSSQTPPG